MVVRDKCFLLATLDPVLVMPLGGVGVGGLGAGTRVGSRIDNGVPVVDPEVPPVLAWYMLALSIA